jgi:hypothetical protein
MLLVQVPDELQGALEAYCQEYETTPSETVNDLLAGLLLNADGIIVMDTGISVLDIITAFCMVLDGTQTQGLTEEQVDHISKVRAAVHDIWIETL